MQKVYKLGILSSHPIQYYSPIYKALSSHPDIELKVYYCHNQTASDQSDAGFNVDFEWDIALLEGYEYKFLNNVSSKPNVNKFFGCDTPEIKKIIKNFHFDAFIVHGWYLKSFWQAIISCRETNTPIMIRGDSQLVTKRTLVKRVLKYPLYRLLISRFNAYLNVGSRSKEYYLNYGANKKNIFFSPHCVDNEYFINESKKLTKEKPSIRKELSISEDSFIFLFVGKLIDKKRPLDFVRAINKAQKINSKIFGLIVGDGILRKIVEDEITKYSSNIRMLGFLNQSEIVKAYSASDCLILPSDGGETWGLVVNEAMACGLPAIVSDTVGCSPDLILEGKTGQVYSLGDTNSLANKIKEMSDRDTLNIMGKNAKNHIKHYSVENSIKGIIDSLKYVT